VPGLYKIITAWEFKPGSSKRIELLAENVWSIIQSKKMKGINKAELKNKLSVAATEPGFKICTALLKNIYHNRQNKVTNFEL
jgi:hypothetical protein